MLLIKHKNIQDLLRRAILKSPISVIKTVDNDGFCTICYTFTDEFNTTCKLEQTPVFRTNGDTTYMYSIFLEHFNIADAIISCNEKTLQHDEQMILNFFQLCSQRVIYQEMQSDINKIFLSDRSKKMN